MPADRVAGLSTGERRLDADATDDNASSSNGSDANIIKLDSRTSLSRKDIPVKTRALSGRDR